MKAPCALCLVIAGMLVASGCTVMKVPEATSGSRADGVVNLAYEYGMFEVPKVDWDQAQLTALRRCQAWNYSAAEAFGGHTQHCEQQDGYGNCLRWLVTVSYQCTGFISQNADVAGG
jgi:YecR-like lipoprotein